MFSFLWGWASDKWGRKPVLLLSLVGSVLSFLWLGFAEALWMLFAARAMGGIFGANIAVGQAYIADVTPAEGRAKGLGLFGAAFGLGFVLGPAIGGILAGPDAAEPGFPHALPGGGGDVVRRGRLRPPVPPGAPTPRTVRTALQHPGAARRSREDTRHAGGSGSPSSASP